MRPRVLLAAVALIFIAPSHPRTFAPSHARTLAPSHLAAAPQQQAARTFLCGEDQSIPPLTVTWTSMVLAGDGRLYVPCPGRPGSTRVHTVEHRENREQSALNIGLTMINPEIRWRAAQAMARINMPVVFKGTTPAPNAGPPDTYYGVYLDSTLGMLQKRPLPTQFIPVCAGDAQLFGGFDQLRRWQPGPLFQFLVDDNPEIRKEAAYAIGTRLSAEDLDPDLVTAALKEFMACWLRQSEPVVQSVMLETLGQIRYVNTEQLQQAEAFLVKESQGSRVKILGAVRGLEALVRRNPKPGPTEATRIRLRELVSYGNRFNQAEDAMDPRVRRLALSALMTASDIDLYTYQVAANDADFQMRRLIASRLNINDEAHARIAEMLAVDPAFQVRYDFLSSVGRWVSMTKLCEPLADRFKDPNTQVVMHAMDLLSPSCTDLDDIVPTLIEWADQLTKPGAELSWHIPTRALEALARVRPAEARRRIGVASRFPVWQVRAAVASMAVSLNNPAVAITMMADPEPNVRSAALEALIRLQNPEAPELAIKILQSTTRDYQLLRTAALALHGVAGELKERAGQLLLESLRRVTDEENDTSRDTRLAMLERLAEVLPSERASDFFPWLSDYDDEVVAMAAKGFKTLVGVAPADSDKRRRYPLQPTIFQLSNLPPKAIIQLEDGDVELQLLTDVAPVTVARFASLIASGSYHDRTFHRIVPNFIVQGGSPGANDLAAATGRFMRDEVGPQASHVRGAVGMSSRSADAGDGQIFIDLVDLPQLDRDYTVFAYVINGMEYVDGLLDGAKIRNIVIKR